MTRHELQSEVIYIVTEANEEKRGKRWMANQIGIQLDKYHQEQLSKEAPEEVTDEEITKNLEEWHKKTYFRQTSFRKWFMKGVTETLKLSNNQCKCNTKEVEPILQLESKRLEWSLKTFPEATAMSSLLKLQGEAEEVKEDIEKRV